MTLPHIAGALVSPIGNLTVELQFQPYRIVGIASFSSMLNQNIVIVPLEGLRNHVQSLFHYELVLSVPIQFLTRNKSAVEAVVHSRRSCRSGVMVAARAIGRASSSSEKLSARWRFIPQPRHPNASPSTRSIVRQGTEFRREFVDSETGDLVEPDDQVKGYEAENGEYVVLEPEEVASAVPNSDKTLLIEAFVPCNEIDDAYLTSPII